MKKTGDLKAAFRHNHKDWKNKYPQSKAILLISVGQLYHEGEKFAATINLLNRTKFKECTIVLGDIIQRYDYLIHKNMTREEAYKTAKLNGDKWLKRNEKHYSRINTPYTISRWTSWLEHPKYDTYRNKLGEAYNSDLDVKKNFHISIQEFITRYKNNNNLDMSNYNNTFKLCLEYLLEECSIIMPIWNEEKYDYLIYPRKMLRAMQITSEKLVKPFGMHSLTWLPLRFKRKLGVNYKNA